MDIQKSRGGADRHVPVGQATSGWSEARDAKQVTPQPEYGAPSACCEAATAAR